MPGLICKFWEGIEREGKKEAYGVSINFTFFFFVFQTYPKSQLAC